MSTDGYLLLAALALVTYVLFGLSGIFRYIARKEAERVLRQFVLMSRATRRGEQPR